MEANNKTMEDVNKWWYSLVVNKRRELTKQYQPQLDKDYGFNRAYLFISDFDKKAIYKAEHPETLNKEQGAGAKTTCPHCGAEKKIFSGLCSQCGKFPPYGMKEQGTEDSPDLLDGITPEEEFSTEKWILEGRTFYCLHETGRFERSGKKELCNKFYFNIQPDYGRGIADNMGEQEAVKIFNSLNAAPKLAAENKELRDHVLNFLGLIDTPVGRRKYKDHPLLWEAIQAAKKTIHHD